MSKSMFKIIVVYQTNDIGINGIRIDNMAAESLPWMQL